MIFTSLIIFAVSDRGLYANLPLYTAGSRFITVTRTHRYQHCSSLTHPHRKVLTHADAKTAVNPDSLNSIA